MYVSLGQVDRRDYCEPSPNACFSSFQTMDDAETMCQYGHVPPPRPDQPCPSSHIITPDNVRKFLPCSISPDGNDIDICQTRAEWDVTVTPEEERQQYRQQHVDVPPPAEGEELPENGDDKNNMMLYGIIGIVAVGGIAFFMARK